MRLIDKLAETGTIFSFSEGKRLVKQGAVSVNDEVVNDWDKELVEGEEVKINVGKTREFKGKI